MIAAGIAAVWLGAVGWLVKREYLRPRAELLAEAALSVGPGATYYRLLLGGEQIGFASSQVDTLADTVRLDDQMSLRIPALGTIQRIEARTRSNLSRTLRVRGFDASVTGDAARFAVRGTVIGDTTLSVEIESADSRQTFALPLKRPIVLPGLVPLRVAFGGDVEVGRSYSLPMFDPLQLAEREVIVRVTAESTFVVPDSAAYQDSSTMWVAARWDTVHAWHVTQEAAGITLEAWIDDLGQIVSATTPVGFTMERTAFEIAFENFVRRDASRLAPSPAGDLIRQTAIAANTPLPDEDLQLLRVRLLGVNLDAFDLAGGRQSISGDTLTVRREGVAALSGRARLPNEDTSLAWATAPEPLVQSDDPRIAAQARQIVGRTRDPARAARLLTQWVHDNLDKRITVSVPSATEVLQARRGDCNEHTVLYVALARAVGLPARTAAGLAYVNGRFYYHAWPEVWLGEWVAVDPTFGQFPADAAHLRFTVGGLARQVELVRLIGRLNLDVIEARTAEE
jgi:transglutaminase-like putative cysteine protease